MSEQIEKDDAKIVAEWMGWDIKGQRGQWNWNWGNIRQVERKLAEDGLAQEYAHALNVCVHGEGVAFLLDDNDNDIKLLMTATDAQRIEAAARVLRNANKGGGE